MSKKRKNKILAHVGIVHIISIILFFILNFFQKDLLSPITDKIAPSVDKVVTTIVPEVDNSPRDVGSENTVESLDDLSIDYEKAKSLLKEKGNLTDSEIESLIKLAKSKDGTTLINKISSCKNLDEIKEVLNEDESKKVLKKISENISPAKLWKITIAIVKGELND